MGCPQKQQTGHFPTQLNGHPLVQGPLPCTTEWKFPPTVEWPISHTTEWSSLRQQTMVKQNGQSVTQRNCRPLVHCIPKARERVTQWGNSHHRQQHDTSSMTHSNRAQQNTRAKGTPVIPIRAPIIPSWKLKPPCEGSVRSHSGKISSNPMWAKPKSENRKLVTVEWSKEQGALGSLGLVGRSRLVAGIRLLRPAQEHFVCMFGIYTFCGPLPPPPSCAAPLGAEAPPLDGPKSRSWSLEINLHT